MVTVTWEIVLSEHVMPHTAVFAVARCKVHGWPALLDFQTLKGSSSGLAEGLLGKFWIVFKKRRHIHTHTHWHPFFFFVLKGPLCAFLSFPPTQSSLLTLSVAETTCVLFSWIFRARLFSMFSRHFRVVGVAVVHVYWGSLVSKILLHSLVHILWSHIPLTQISAVYQKEISHYVGHKSPRALLLKAALLTFWTSVAKASPGRVFYLWLMKWYLRLVSSCPCNSEWPVRLYERPLQSSQLWLKARSNSMLWQWLFTIFPCYTLYLVMFSNSVVIRQDGTAACQLI